MRHIQHIQRIALMLALSFAITASAQTRPATGGETKQNAAMCQCCQDMMAHEKMMAAQKQQFNDKLDSMVREMNQAPNNLKLERAIAVINEMAAQRKAMDEMTATMQEGMMERMKNASGQCSMMNQ